MKVLKIVLVVAVVLAVLVVGIGLALPRDWNVDRSILIQAPPSKIHPWVEAPSRWNEWFAWEEMKSDPAYKVWTSGPEKGEGATYEWTGNAAGHGRIVIASSDPKTGVYLDEWIEADPAGPRNARGTIVYTGAEGGATRVTWSDAGTLPPVIGGFLRGTVNSAIGKAFEKGLANLKTKVEASK